jgi:glycosyltransferase involved in cell wall biosynthesis
MPKVSILTPIYRTKEEYLREAIESILNQTFTDFEFLILDDCPEDDREKIVASYHDKRIKYFKNDQNIGISASRNKLIDLAEGEYLAVFDHDDISMPDRLEKEVKYLDEHPEIGVVSGQLEYFPKTTTTKHPELNGDIKKSLMFADVVAHTAMMIRKSILSDSGIRYESRYSPAEDYKICLTLIGYTMFYNFPEVLVRYRNFEGNTSHLQKSKMADRDALCKCFAAREYPYLYQQLSIAGVVKKKVWLRLFGIIPFIKLKTKANKIKIYLFGFLPLFSIKG